MEIHQKQQIGIAAPRRSSHKAPLHKSFFDIVKSPGLVNKPTKKPILLESQPKILIQPTIKPTKALADSKRYNKKQTKYVPSMLWKAYVHTPLKGGSIKAEAVSTVFNTTQSENMGEFKQEATTERKEVPFKKLYIQEHSPIIEINEE